MINKTNKLDLHKNNILNNIPDYSYKTYSNQLLNKPQSKNSNERMVNINNTHNKLENNKSQTKNNQTNLIGKYNTSDKIISSKSSNKNRKFQGGTNSNHKAQEINIEKNMRNNQHNTIDYTSFKFFQGPNNNRCIESDKIKKKKINLKENSHYRSKTPLNDERRDNYKRLQKTPDRIGSKYKLNLNPSTLTPDRKHLNRNRSFITHTNTNNIFTTLNNRTTTNDNNYNYNTITHTTKTNSLSKKGLKINNDNFHCFNNRTASATKKKSNLTDLSPSFKHCDINNANNFCIYINAPIVNKGNGNIKNQPMKEQNIKGVKQRVFSAKGKRTNYIKPNNIKQNQIGNAQQILKNANIQNRSNENKNEIDNKGEIFQSFGVMNNPPRNFNNLNIIAKDPYDKKLLPNQNFRQKENYLKSNFNENKKTQSRQINPNATGIKNLQKNKNPMDFENILGSHNYREYELPNESNIDFNELDQFSPPYQGKSIKLDFNLNNQQNTNFDKYTNLEITKNNTLTACPLSSNRQKIDDFISQIDFGKKFSTIQYQENSTFRDNFPNIQQQISNLYKYNSNCSE